MSASEIAAARFPSFDPRLCAVYGAEVRPRGGAISASAGIPHSRCSRHAMLIVRGRVPFAPVRRCRNPLKMVRVDFHPGWDVCSRSALRRIMAIRAEAIP